MMSALPHHIDINSLCNIKGSLHVSLLDKNCAFLACNKLKLDFCRDLYGREEIIGFTPCSFMSSEDMPMIEKWYQDHKTIIREKTPKQYYHTWLVKGRFRLDLLSIKIPIFDTHGDVSSVLTISHFIKKFSVERPVELGLAKREAECLFYLLEGCTAKEIGKALGISYRTVEGYIESMKNKLKCSTTTELLLKALQCEINEDIRSDFSKHVKNHAASLAESTRELVNTEFISIPLE